MQKAIILLSGGLDSATALSIALKEGKDVFPLSFDYNQRNALELNAAKRVIEHFGIKNPHKIITLDLGLIGGSALTDMEIDVPKNRDTKEEKIPSTYVPARNTIFLSIALGYAEVIGASEIYIGANMLDYSGYPDCRQDYFEAFEKLMALATAKGREQGEQFKIKAPLLYLNKKEIIEIGLNNGVDYSLTLSCYDPLPDASPCGECDPCQFRREAFAHFGLDDTSVA